MKLLLGTTMIAGLMIAGAAQAADMPLKAPSRSAPVYSGDWTGFYVFGFGGYSWGKIKPDDFDVGDLTDGAFHNPKPKGGVFGFGGGYNWQYGAWVGGVEVDYGFSDEKDNQSFSFESCTSTMSGLSKQSISCDGSISLNSKIDALGSARLRVGYLFTPNLLAYGTAGLGWGRAKVSISADDCEGFLCSFSAKPNLFGWVAGGGLEYKLFEHVRVRGEYLHYDFGSTSYAFQPIITLNAKTTDDVARGALIWSFN
jgi:outer membrane immunogenic protein